jgi:F-type H+-transporting ATPase subunit epsilon
MPEATQKKLQCVIVTPETTVLDRSVDFVAIPLYDGELGVLPGRAPLVARLGYGELRIKAGAEQASYFVDGGFLQVRSDVVSILTARAVPAANVDAAAARAAIEKANAGVPTTPQEFEAKVISLSRARGQIDVARRAGKASVESS